jgi:hypothetical protein
MLAFRIGNPIFSGQFGLEQQKAGIRATIPTAQKSAGIHYCGFIKQRLALIGESGQISAPPGVRIMRGVIQGRDESEK